MEPVHVWEGEEVLLLPVRLLPHLRLRSILANRIWPRWRKRCVDLVVLLHHLVDSLLCNAGGHLDHLWAIRLFQRPLEHCRGFPNPPEHHLHVNFAILIKREKLDLHCDHAVFDNDQVPETAEGFRLSRYVGTTYLPMHPRIHTFHHIPSSLDHILRHAQPVPRRQCGRRNRWGRTRYVELHQYV